jgi:predicted DNA repair protein MutK
VIVVANPEVDLAAFEKDKIKGAIRTDFILSAEIIAITLGTVADAPLMQQVVVLSGIAIVMTVGVYGVVAGIVKMDDGGLYLTQKTGEGTWPRFQRRFGQGVLNAAPYMMKALTVIGTAAMFMVGGGILVHGVPLLHHWVESAALSSAPFVGPLSVIVPTLLNAVAGIIAGAVVLAGVTAASSLWRAIKG